MTVTVPDGALYTLQDAERRIAQLNRYGIWPGMITVPGTGMVRLTHDPDMAGMPRGRAAEPAGAPA